MPEITESDAVVEERGIERYRTLVIDKSGDA